MTSKILRPRYDDLPMHPKAEKRSAWGIWDQGSRSDHLGSLNNLTPEIKVTAAQEVQYGLSFQLDWMFSKFGSPPFGRQDFEHKIINYEPITGEMAHDDVVSFNTQVLSQWDGFMHYADQKIGYYYNGLKHTDDVASTPATHGIDAWCEKGIAGRGVLLDWPRWLTETGREQLSSVASHAISVNDLQAIAIHQGLSFKPGDILIIRTGFGGWLQTASESNRTKVFSSLSFSGVKQGDDTQRWLWDTGFSAVAADSVSWECYPPPKDGSMLHQWLLPHAGIPIGELLNLEALADACAAHKKWSFLFTSAPLNVRGGIASPLNAIALL